MPKLRFGMLLAAALLAALGAHVAIDVLGDYVLPHDLYDDAAHGSRLLATGAFAVCAFAVIVMLVRAVFAEIRGSREMLRAVLRRSVPSSRAHFALQVLALAIPLLLGMAWLDAHVAGIDVDDIGDLFGGSVLLGMATLSAFAAGVAVAVHHLTCVLARFHRKIVHAVETLLCVCAGSAGSIVVALPAIDRPRISPALALCVRANRAPPGCSKLHL